MFLKKWQRKKEQFIAVFVNQYAHMKNDNFELSFVLLKIQKTTTVFKLKRDKMRFFVVEEMLLNWKCFGKLKFNCNVFLYCIQQKSKGNKKKKLGDQFDMRLMNIHIIFTRSDFSWPNHVLLCLFYQFLPLNCNSLCL